MLYLKKRKGIYRKCAQISKWFKQQQHKQKRFRKFFRVRRAWLSIWRKVMRTGYIAGATQAGAKLAGLALRELCRFG